MIGWEIVKMTKEFITETLNYYFQTPDCELHYKHDYELLLSVMLSAQTTDKRVNEVMDPIFKKYNTLEKLEALREEVKNHPAYELFKVELDNAEKIITRNGLNLLSIFASDKTRLSIA